jgi:hypothetical protein
MRVGVFVTRQIERERERESEIEIEKEREREGGEMKDPVSQGQL